MLGRQTAFFPLFELFDAFLYDGCVHSFETLQQLISYGGEVLPESWKKKGTSERKMIRYTQQLIFHFRQCDIFV